MKINETIRKDGLRIISCRLPHRKRVWIDLIARVGSAYDPVDKTGFFHCFEHMAFKGTKKRSIKDIQSFARKNLLLFNAHTDKLLTVYEVSAIDRKLPQVCEYLCDIYFNSIFPAGELQKEKRAIHLEIARNNDNDAVTAYEALYEHLYKSNPVRRHGGGTIEGIDRIRRSDLIAKKSTWYVPSNTIALAIGGVNHVDFVKEINRHIPLNNAVAPRKYWRDAASEPPLKREFTVVRPKREKTILILGCKIPLDIDMRTTETFSMFSKMIGGSNTSRLWNEVREKRGLAYTIGSSYFIVAGLADQFSAYAEIHPSKDREVERIIWKALTKPIFESREFDELREKTFDSFEIRAFEQSNVEGYENLILDKIAEEKPVMEVETEDKRRLEIIKSLSLKDLNAVQRQFIRPERFLKVVLRPEQ